MPVAYLLSALLQLDKCGVGNLWRAAIARAAMAIGNGRTFVKKFWKFYWWAVEKVFYFGGILAFIVGVGKIYKPLGYIVGGLIAYAQALLISKLREMEQRAERL